MLRGFTSNLFLFLKMTLQRNVVGSREYLNSNYLYIFRYKGFRIVDWSWGWHYAYGFLAKTEFSQAKGSIAFWEYLFTLMLLSLKVEFLKPYHSIKLLVDSLRSCLRVFLNYFTSPFPCSSTYLGHLAWPLELHQWSTVLLWIFLTQKEPKLNIFKLIL